MRQQGHYWHGEFRAMASPCEVLVETSSSALARRLCLRAMEEAIRIEHKFSRYRDDSIVQKINMSCGQSMKVDPETARLLDFAAQCFELSDGLFDITSGVLRKAWNFREPDSAIPPQATLDTLLEHIGWQKVSWTAAGICLPEGMQIDLGGIGKEYAVDSVAEQLRGLSKAPVLVNFGGDLHATREPRHSNAWDVGIRLAEQGQSAAARTIHLQRGAMATSGDAERYLMSLGVRYGHVLNPKTGWPVPGGPHSVTVAGSTCTEAGVLSTLALLHGSEAESFLQAQDAVYWCQW